MNLEEKKVLLSRWDIIRQWKDKEWWYSGFYDTKNDIYFNFFFVRVNFIDQFTLTLFEVKEQKIYEFSKKLFLDKKQKKNKLCLNYHSKNISIEYNGDEIEGWTFKFKNNNFDIDLYLKPTIPYFTKFENQYVYKYGLMHYFNNLTNGLIKISNKTYKIENALCYYDHCFGTIPSKSAWHWIAVQNEDVSLASLVNYGPYAQKYSEIYFKKNDRNWKLNEWIRLNQDVSFEHYELDDKLMNTWKITSTDMDVIVTPIMYILDRTKVPKALPFLDNIKHYEFFIKLSGNVRIDGQWIEIKDLYGIMEQHNGKW
ncbi:hypothetical protein ACN077_16375 [Clostridium chromiireducens]|uniref:DUF2804 family protein n=1 Tax=Clostridium chromiireducens TaxID=225345 RepID=UPI003AF77B68